MTYIQINNKRYPATVTGGITDRTWDGRSTMTITIATDYDSMCKLFPAGALLDWSVIDERTETVILTDEDGAPRTDEAGVPLTEERTTETETDQSARPVVGPITDNRNGTYTVKMGARLAAELQREAANATAALTTLAGEDIDPRTAVQLRAVIETQMQSADDETALQAPTLYPVWSPTGDYVNGYRVRYNGTLYKCLGTHSAQEDWTPADAPSLWTKVLIPDPDTVPEWEQPDSTNPYSAGDKVTHSGKTWTSDIDNNVWEPGAYGWTEVTETETEE